MSHITYRPDIDGLRALAVALVLGYHFVPSLVPAGFIGVDIFFVISGYLVTRIILKDLILEKFSLASFYARRIRRIFPALLCVLITVSLIGWLILIPTEFQRLGKHILGGIAFIANIVLYHEVGYFDASANSKPLLHLWSLGVEEQFYIIFPVILLILWKLKIKLILALPVMAGVSLIINVVVVSRHPSAVFYLPVFRFWELLVGSILACGLDGAANRISSFCSFNRGALGTIGLGSIAIAILVIDPHVGYPGWWAMLPTVGAALIIAAGPNIWLNQRVFGNKAVVFIGLISYPLYLWHWPIISFLMTVSNQQPSSSSKFIGLLMTFILSVATYKLIEKPIRGRQAAGSHAIILLTLALVMGVVGFAIQQRYIEPRLESSLLLKPIMAALHDWDFPEGDIFIEGKKPGEILFIGDSFLQHYYSRIRKITKDSESSPAIRFLGVGGCPPLPGVSRIADPGGCLIKNAEAFSEANKEGVTKVVFGSAWHYFYPVNERSKQLDRSTFEQQAGIYREGDVLKQAILVDSQSFKAAFESFEDMVSELVDNGKKVYIVLPTPISDQFDPRLMIDRINGKPRLTKGITKAEYISSFAPVITVLQSVANSSGAILLDPSKDLCVIDFCRSFQGDAPIYSDIGHIRPYFSENYIAVFDKIILE